MYYRHLQCTTYILVEVYSSTYLYVAAGNSSLNELDFNSEEELLSHISQSFFHLPPCGDCLQHTRDQLCVLFQITRGGLVRDDRVSVCECVCVSISE